MKYVFEDNGNDVFSILFKKCYPTEISDKFVYAKGICRASNVATNLLRTEDIVFMFMDLVPDNASLARQYDILAGISKEYDNRLVLILIPCIEYEFIKSVSGIINNNYTRRCLAYDEYRDLLSSEDELAYCKTFERFCKMIVKNKLKVCMSTDTRLNPDSYYFRDNCEELTMVQKSEKLLAQFPAVPLTGTIAGQSLNLDQCWEVHRETVNFYNEAVTRFRLAGIKARYIKPIK